MIANKDHIPAAERQTGINALKKYAIGAGIMLLILFFYSRPIIEDVNNGQNLNDLIAYATSDDIYEVVKSFKDLFFFLILLGTSGYIAAQVLEFFGLAKDGTTESAFATAVGLVIMVLSGSVIAMIFNAIGIFGVDEWGKKKQDQEIIKSATENRNKYEKDFPDISIIKSYSYDVDGKKLKVLEVKDSDSVADAISIKAMIENLNEERGGDYFFWPPFVHYPQWICEGDCLDQRGAIIKALGEHDLIVKEGYSTSGYKTTSVIMEDLTVQKGLIDGKKQFLKLNGDTARLSHKIETSFAPIVTDNKLNLDINGLTKYARFWLLALGAFLLVFYVLTADGFGIFKRNLFFAKIYPPIAAGLIALYLASFPFIGDEFFIDWKAVSVFLLPLIAFVAPVYWLMAVEYLKETSLYRRIAILGKGVPTGRMGGIKSFIKRDVSNYFSDMKSGIKRKKKSMIYLGRPYFEDDIKLGGRDIGIISQQHMITIAGSGGGKSRDAIKNTLLTWCGGVVGFDPKGEHVRDTFARRNAYSPSYVLDPFGMVSDIVDTSYWNPLGDIDSTSISARADLGRLASASIFLGKGGGDNSEHFTDNALMILRGFMTHVLTTFPPEQRHLGTVYDLIKKGNPDSNFYSPKDQLRTITEMVTNSALGGSAQDVPNFKSSVSEREWGSYMSTIFRGIDWINEASVRKIIGRPSSFSLKDCKTKEASVYLVLPEKHLSTLSRFLRTFYTSAFDLLDENETPQPEGSKRQVLFLFDEFNTLGRFKPAEDAANFKRSSNLKCWFIVQNVDQFYKNYDNAQNFFNNCDKQFFAIAADDEKGIKLLKNALGTYAKVRREGMEGSTRSYESNYGVMGDVADIAEYINAENSGQIVLPIEGKPLKLKRIPYYKNFSGFKK